MSNSKRSLPALVSILAVGLSSLVMPPTVKALGADCTTEGITVSALHRPDNTPRPFYADFSVSSTKHSGYAGYTFSDTGGLLGENVWIKLANFSGGSLGLATNQSAAQPIRSTSSSGLPITYFYLTAANKVTPTTTQSFDVEVYNGKPGQGGTLVCTYADQFSGIETVISANANKITTVTVSTASPALGQQFTIDATGETGTRGAGIATDRFEGFGVFSMSPSMDDNWPANSFNLVGLTMTVDGVTYQDQLRVYPTQTTNAPYSVSYGIQVRGATATTTPVAPVQNIASGTQVKYTGAYDQTGLIPIPTSSITISKTTTSVVPGTGYTDVAYKVDLANSASTPVTADGVIDLPTPSDAWSYTAGTATLDSVPIPDPYIADNQMYFPGPLEVPANGTLTLRYTLRLVGTASNDATAEVGTIATGDAGGGNTIVVVLPVEIVTTTLDSGTQGTPYEEALEATSGTGPYTWALTNGSLPAGISLDQNTGVISGTPTETGSFPLTVSVTDSTSATDGGPYTDTRSYTLVVATAPITLTPSTLPHGTPDEPYNQTLSASGGDGGPYTWAVSSGNLPPGLTLDPNTGEISGTPTTPGTYTFTVTATDTNGAVGSRPFTVEANQRPAPPTPGPNPEPAPPAPADDTAATPPTDTRQIPPVRETTTTEDSVTIPISTLLPGLSPEETWDPPTMALIDPITRQPVTEWNTPEGRWVVAQGDITFIPAPGYTGTARATFTIRSTTGLLYTGPLEVTVERGKIRYAKTSVTVYFDSMSPHLDAQARRTLNRFIASVRAKSEKIVRVTVVGYVQPTPQRGNDVSLSTARAKNTAAYLKKRGIKPIEEHVGLGRANQTGWKARRATATVYYIPR